MRKAPIFPVLTIILAVALLSIFYLSVRAPIKILDKNTEEQSDLQPLEQPTVVFGNPMIGSNEAKVTIVEFSDYLCIPCSTLNFNLKRLATEYPNDIRLVWKDFPNESQHPGATKSAIAARCAAYQGAFWEFQQILMSGQAGAGIESYNIMASELGLNMDQYQSCLAENQPKALIERDVEEALRLRLDATPYIFINDRRFSGAVSYDLLKNIVEGEINKILRTEAEPNTK